MLAIFLGSGLIGREFERRTIHVALSHPISRGQFVMGKFVGFAGVLALNWALLSLAYLAISADARGHGWDVAPTLACSLGLALLESLCLASMAICFSTFTTVSLSAMFTIGLYLVGQ